jgi:ABC-type dipeptide/oligopeptide/nickel transport system permease component
MAKYIRKRLALAVPTVLLTSLVVFLMLFLTPGDPASIYVGEQAATPERLADIRRVMGLDRPLHVCSTGTSCGARCGATSGGRSRPTGPCSTRS